MSPFLAIDYESLMHWLAELSRTESLYLRRNGLSERVSQKVNLPSIPITCSLHFVYPRVKKRKKHQELSKVNKHPGCYVN